MLDFIFMKIGNRLDQDRKYGYRFWIFKNGNAYLFWLIAGYLTHESLVNLIVSIN